MDLPDAIAALQGIVDAAPEQLVVLLTIDAEEEAAFAALQLGAAGVLSKDVDLDDALPRALRGAAAGEAVISRRIGMLLLQRLRHVPDVAGLRPVKGPLTQREWEVIDLLLDGHNTDDIARALVISTETVRSHVKNILRKLGARNRADAVLAAQRLRGAAADL
jgi:DNA-binding NarL/FixJ family response regulator